MNPKILLCAYSFLASVRLSAEADAVDMMGAALRYIYYPCIYSMPDPQCQSFKPHGEFISRQITLSESPVPVKIRICELGPFEITYRNVNRGAK